MRPGQREERPAAGSFRPREEERPVRIRMRRPQGGGGGRRLVRPARGRRRGPVAQRRGRQAPEKARRFPGGGGNRRWSDGPQGGGGGPVAQGWGALPRMVWRRSQGGGGDRRRSGRPEGGGEGPSYIGGTVGPGILCGGPREEEGTAAFPCPQGGGGGLRIGLDDRAFAGHPDQSAATPGRRRSAAAFAKNPGRRWGSARNLICRRRPRGPPIGYPCARCPDRPVRGRSAS